jgi:hypothetical protein
VNINSNKTLTIYLNVYIICIIQYTFNINLFMQFITSTELRTKSTELIDVLASGKKVSLLHRSRLVGVIEPVKSQPAKAFDASVVRKKLSKISKSKITAEEIERRYHNYLVQRYGKHLS